jgi:hypothetical protein
MLTTIFIVMVLQAVQADVPPDHGLPLEGTAAEEFLRTAEVVEMGEITKKGITQPVTVVLSDGRLRLKAVFKTHDEFSPVKDVGHRRWVNFRDSYKHEIAAYELDKLMGTDLVPPCVERRLTRSTGAVCLWVEGIMSEVERIEGKIKPPDTTAWNHQVYNLWLFQTLIADTDYRNLNNVLVDPDFRIYKIDSSRAFRNDGSLSEGHHLTHFSCAVIHRLRKISNEDLKNALGQWLDKAQIKGLGKRRNRILALADEMIAEKGDDAVLVP